MLVHFPGSLVAVLAIAVMACRRFDHHSMAVRPNNIRNIGGRHSTV